MLNCINHQYHEVKKMKQWQQSWMFLKLLKHFNWDLHLIYYAFTVVIMTVAACCHILVETGYYFCNVLADFYYYVNNESVFGAQFVNAGFIWCTVAFMHAVQLSLLIVGYVKCMHAYILEIVWA